MSSSGQFVHGVGISHMQVALSSQKMHDNADILATKKIQSCDFSGPVLSSIPMMALEVAMLSRCSAPKVLACTLYTSWRKCLTGEGQK